jgi:uncharacterized protein (TIGR02145 family)
VIAAKDSDGTILWSWHIWMTDQPQEQVYYNDAGTMMDRNLGATSAEPGQVGALGLLYQWGRKDPFLGASSIDQNIVAVSVNQVEWDKVQNTNETGCIEYAIEHPTHFIHENSTNYDWLYGTSDKTRWSSTKTIYDPCPIGWRVPDGGTNGIWLKALGMDEISYSIKDINMISNNGLNTTGKFGDTATIWYPCSGMLYNGLVDDIGSLGRYWAATAVNENNYAYFMNMSGTTGYIRPSWDGGKYLGYSVRCVKEE